MEKAKKLLCMLCAIAILGSCVACGNNNSAGSDVSGDAGFVGGEDVYVDGTDDGAYNGTGTGNNRPSGGTTNNNRPSGGTTNNNKPSGGTTNNNKPSGGTTNNNKPSGGTAQNTSKDTYGVRSDTYVANQPKVIDMKGATLVLTVKGKEAFGNGKAGESASGDRWRAWRSKFQKTYNCKLQNKVVSNPFDIYAELASKMMSGEKIGDVLAVQLFDLEKFRHAGLLQPLQSCESLNLNQKGVVQDMVNKFTFNGNSYFYASGNFDEVCGLYFNKDIIKELKLEDPYALVKSKKWTWDKFSSMANAAWKDLNGNNKGDKNDRIGAYIRDDFVQAALAVSGIKVISYQNGGFHYTFNTANTLTWLNAAKKTVHNERAVIGFNQLTGSQAVDKFVKGELLFFEGESNILGNKDHKFWNIKFDYGFLPVPTFQTGKGYSNSGSTWLGGYAIPKNTEQNKYIGYFLNSYTEQQLSEANETKKEYTKFFGGDTTAYELFNDYSKKFNTDLYCWQQELKDGYTLQFTNHLFEEGVTGKGLLDKIDTQMKNRVKDYYDKDPDLMD